MTDSEKISTSLIKKIRNFILNQSCDCCSDGITEVTCERCQILGEL